MPWCVLLLRDVSLRANRLMILIEEPAPERRGHLRQRPIGDVLTREGLLMHPRAHVARIDEDSRDSLVEQFDGQRPGQEFECGLARAVRTPAGIGAVCRVAGDVDDKPVTRGEEWQRELDERDWRAGIDRKHAAEALDVESHQ